MEYQSYTPIDPDFYDIVDEQIGKSRKLKIFYFQPDKEIGQAEGEYKGILKEKDGDFIEISDNKPVRMDRIITINGKPGPAFDEYDNYANACLSCRAGYDE